MECYRAKKFGIYLKVFTFALPKMTMRAWRNW